MSQRQTDIAMVNKYEVDLQLLETRVDGRVYGGHTGVIVLQTLSGYIITMESEKRERRKNREQDNDTATL